jgi:hypothetical protein
VKDPSKILWAIVAGLVIWTTVLAVGAYLGPRARPTGEPIERERTESGEPVPLSPRAQRNKMLRPAIVLGCTAALLAFWGAMFVMRARRLAKREALKASMSSAEIPPSKPEAG